VIIVLEEVDGRRFLRTAGDYMMQQDRQCMYNVTLRSVRVTIVAVEKQLSITQLECVYLLP